MNAQTNEERLARLEATLDHLATKEDVAVLKADLYAMKAELTRTIYVAVTSSVVLISAIIALATAAQIVVK